MFYCTALADEEMPAEMAIEIRHSKGEQAFFIQPKIHKGDWISLGIYDFDPDKQAIVSINGEQTDGPLFADALLCVPR